MNGFTIANHTRESSASYDTSVSYDEGDDTRHLLAFLLGVYWGIIADGELQMFARFRYSCEYRRYSGEDPILFPRTPGLKKRRNRWCGAVRG